MSYQIKILRQAQKFLGSLYDKDYERIKESIQRLSDEPRPAGCLKLSGREGWRIRIGNYRVIYEIEEREKIVTILAIAHRRDAYR
ncbi:MAG: type II toxin-antitoxin system RelE/ParE family toxin [Chloroflexaceae bacterium]|nr:type II toxin-antitoxin system RelE/ParE family toxin [Chloroflexaceae bacterium]